MLFMFDYLFLAISYPKAEKHAFLATLQLGAEDALSTLRLSMEPVLPARQACILMGFRRA